MSVVFWVIFCLFVLDLLEFVQGKVELDRIGERWCGDGCFVVVLGVSLG